ncbi:MAG: hypothetical protein ACLPSY_09190 [Steroidobacteraceae bacterium]
MDPAALNRALELIEARTSISTVEEFLRAKGVPHSAQSWKQLCDSRIRPAIKNGKLTDQDIRVLLREAEDFGRQHVFLYEPSSQNPDPGSLIREDTVKKFLKKKGWDGLVNSVKVVGLPRTTELIDVHFDGGYASFKFVERRKILLQEREETRDGYRVSNVRQERRAINVVRIFDSGLLEFRIATIKGTSDYSASVDELWLLLEDLIPRDHFREKDLSKLRKCFVVNPSQEVKDLVRVRRSSGQDLDGTKFSLAMGNPSGNLLESNRAVQGIAALAGGASTSRLGHTSVGFLPQKDGGPHRELGVILAAGINEVRILPNCTQSEYEYIRGEIAKHSQ